MHVTRIAALLFLAWMLSAGPAPAGEQDGEGTVSGIVFAPETHEPMPGVTIRLETGATLLTDEDGAFEVVLPAGEHDLEFTFLGVSLGGVQGVPVVAGEVTEVLVNLKPAGKAALEPLTHPPDVEVEAPSGSFLEPQVEEYEGVPGTIQGKVIDEEKGKPVAGARIFVMGLSTETSTDGKGWFSLDVRPGMRRLTVVHPEYSTEQVDDVMVTGGQTVSVGVELKPAAVQLEAFTVTAPKIEGAVVALLDEKKESGAVSDVIGAEQMSKSGDSDAAAALKRVTGITVVDGKFVYVRGLGERYSSTLLNGSSLPSPEPEKRVVPLDMFPAELLDSVVIQKSFSPEMPGEFGGGSVQLRTRGFPSEFTANLSLSAGALLGTSFVDGPQYKGGKLDWLGIDDGTRALPGIIPKDEALNLRDAITGLGFPADELERFGEAFPNIWDIENGFTPPDLGLSASIGNSHDVRTAKVGYLVSLTYSNDWERKDKKSTIYNINEGVLEEFHSYQFRQLTNNITLAGIVNLGIDFGEFHKLRLTSILDRISDDEARVYWGQNRDVGGPIRITRLRWVERMLFAQQVHGFHQFPKAMDLQIDWRYTFSMATRLEPDRRTLRWDQEGESDMWLLSNRAENAQRFYSTLTDFNHDVGLDLSLPFLQWFGLEAKAKAGFTTMLKDRAVDSRRLKFYRFGTEVGLHDEILGQPGEVVFSPEYIGPGWFQIIEFTMPTDNYQATQQVFAGYAMIDLPLGAGFRLVTGARVEHSDQHVKTFELFVEPPTEVVAKLETTDVLPAAALTWELPHDMVLRAAYARTLSRPDFRELSEACYNDVTGGRLYCGNADLKRAVLDNVDLRWEWYLAPGETLSFGAFYKHFDDPIEIIVKPTAQLSIEPENANEANNMGLELEWRKSLDFITPKLQDLYVSGNVTLVYSRIKLREGTLNTTRNRPLQGQSPYVINFTLGYDNVDIGTSIAILYNVFGKRIAEVGAKPSPTADGLPDVYEQPFHQLDLVYKQKLPLGFSLGFKAKNLLDLPALYTQGGKQTERWRKGRYFGVSLSMSF
jgi:outer membrane receptor protein involved in Fe transport